MFTPIYFGHNATKEEIIETIKETPSAYRSLAAKWRKDKEIAMIAVKATPLNYYYVQPELRGDRELLLVAINGDPRMLTYADKSLSDDDALREYAFKLNGGAFIVDLVAFERFCKLDERMRMRTTKATTIVRNADGEVDYLDKYDEKALDEDPFYNKFIKFYANDPMNPVTARDIRRYEKYLLETKKAICYIDDKTRIF